MRNIKILIQVLWLRWISIDYACKNGIEKFDFMGAGSPDEDYGVRDFKAKFGGSLVEPGRFIQHIPP